MFSSLTLSGKYSRYFCLPWINDIKKYESILVDNYKDKLKLYKEEGYVFFDWESLVLSDEWMDVSNTILSELMKEI